MKSQVNSWRPVLGLTLLFFASTAEAEMALRSDFGETEFPTSATPESQVHFLEGLLALHSFEYEDARDAFHAAQKVEPGFALAYWGEAMTHSHPIWMKVELEAGRAALARLAETPEKRRTKAPMEREKAYLDAVEILFGEGTKLDRDLAYAAAMGKLAEQYPEDNDAAAFYALALLGTCHNGRDIPTYMRAAAVAEEVFSRNPRHPGAAHYLIHSYDDPVHAPLGLRAARVYAEIAPAAEHALHMPSHVFLALGMWQQTADSNVDSAAAGEARRARRGQGVGKRPYHALAWLHYARLQLGQFDEARKLLASVAEDDRASGEGKISDQSTRSALATMRAVHMVEAGDLQNLPSGSDLSKLSPTQVASSYYADGLAALARNDIEGAGKANDEMLAQYGLQRPEGAAKAMASHINAAGYSRYGNFDFRPVQIMDLELRALVLSRQGRSEEAFALLAEATEIEEQRPFGFGPPIPPKPSHELFGELLLAAGRPAEAAEQFEKALERAPRRALSLAGLVEAAKHSGDEATARRVAAELASFRPSAVVSSSKTP